MTFLLGQVAFRHGRNHRGRENVIEKEYETDTEYNGVAVDGKREGES